MNYRRWEGPVFTFFFVVIVGYVMLLLYAWVAYLTGGL